MPCLTIVIPTKNRHNALAQALKSIFEQTVLPQEVIVVDQSPKSGDAESELMKMLPASVRLDYAWNPAIPGCAVARNVAIERAHEDILLFLDDDVTLYPDFIERLLASYEENHGATGISGIPVNYAMPGKFFYYWSKIFTRGPFWNDRFPVYWNASSLTRPVKVSQMSGGMMSFKRASLGKTRFDSNLKGVSDGEDVDLCVRLKGTYFIDPRCKLTHHFNSSGREKDHWTRRHARAYTYLYLRNWRPHKIAYAWLNAGWLLAALLGCVSRRSLSPLRAMMAGRVEGQECIVAVEP